jgi:hypothetical protein
VPRFTCRRAARSLLRAHSRYATATRRHRATYRFVKPQAMNSQWVFFANPR